MWLGSTYLEGAATHPLIHSSLPYAPSLPSLSLSLWPSSGWYLTYLSRLLYFGCLPSLVLADAVLEGVAPGWGLTQRTLTFSLPPAPL